jgi:4-hydroxybenzoate polyprenyltransferase
MPNAFVSYLKLFRLPFVFTAIADSAAGYLIASKTAPQPRVLGLLALASAGLYAFGMAMNDVADRSRDKTLAPGRPLPSGRITLRGAVTASFLVVAAGGVAIKLLEPKPGPTQALFAAAFVAIMIYDFAIKIPPVMGAIRFFNLLMGVAAAGVSGAWILGLPSLVYGSSLTFVSTLEDREGRKGPRWIGVAGMIGAALAPAVVGRPLAFVPAGLLAAWLVKRALAEPDKKNVMLLVRDGVAGFILLDAALLASFGRNVESAAVAALLLPAFGLMAIFRRLG